jgi:chemotaxis protein MotB
MLKKSFLPVILCSALFLGSCVSSKKYKEANDQIQSLTATNNTLQQQVNDSKQQVSDLTNSNRSMDSKFSSYKSSCEEAQRKLEIYQAALREQYETIKKMEDVINTAVAEFAGHGIEVFEKEGRVYVDMQDKLLYTTGSSKMGDEGKQALSSLANALNQYPNLQVIVVGYTDSVSFRKGSDKDNLSLSTERANGVVRELRSLGVNPDRLVAAGQGKYNPIADNSTEEGRAKNRRTEIILNPDLMKIWEHVENSQSQ